MLLNKFTHGAIAALASVPREQLSDIIYALAPMYSPSAIGRYEVLQKIAFFRKREEEREQEELSPSPELSPKNAGRIRYH